MWLATSDNSDRTRALGAALGRVASGRVVVALVGDLGSGKTCFAKGVGAGLDVAQEIVSPTFTLMAEYEGRLPLLHADTYRLGVEDLPGIGLEDALDRWPGVALVEWADRFADLLPDDHLRVEFHQEGTRRVLAVTASGPEHRTVLEQWREATTHVD